METSPGATRRPEDVESDIVKNVAELMSSCLFPHDLSNLTFEHKLPIPIILSINIRTRSRVLQNGDIEIKSVLIPRGVQQKDEEQVYVIARCVTKKPRI